MINRWVRQTVQGGSSDNPVKNSSLRLFITGNAGTGKSFLIKTLFMRQSKKHQVSEQHVLIKFCC